MLPTPRKRGGPAEQLLVKVVAPTAHRLGQKETGRCGVQKGTEFDPAAAAADPGTQHAQKNSSPDTQSAALDLRDQREVTGAVEAWPEVGVRRRDHVIEPAADDAEGDSPDDNVPDTPLGCPALGPADRSQPQSHHDAGQDAEGIRVDAQ